MLLNGLGLKEILLRLPIIFIAITVHEYAHGYAALKMGDPTAKLSGRLSMNPLAHMDIVGALSMLIFGFGWAKPVPINPNNFKNHKKGTVIVSLAGPISNLFLAFLGSVLYGIFRRIGFGNFSSQFSEIFYGLLAQLILLNVCFGIFNLVPFPPLDGAKIVGAFLPHKTYFKIMQYERYAFPILIVLMYLGIFDKILGVLITPIVSSLNALIALIAGL